MKHVKELLVLSLLFFLFLPRFHEITAETWKVWKAAVLIRETGYFSMFSMGPLYDLYLMFFTFLPFPVSINLEFILTHLFAIFCLKKLLDRYLPWWATWPLVAAWIPNLCLLESTKYVAGIAFLCLHFSFTNDSKWRKSYFPPALLAAVLCSQGYMFFYVGHVVGILISPLFTKVKLSFPKLKIGPILFFQIFLILFFILATIRQSPRTDNNPFMSNSDYYPIPTQSHMTIAFFQMGNYKYVAKNYPEDQWKTKDWFDTNQEAFGGAQSILEAIELRPDSVKANVKESFNDLKRVPAFFLIGNGAFIYDSAQNFVIKLLSFFLIGLAAFFHVKNLNKDSMNAATTLSLLLGGASLVAAILLTWVNFRFFMQLLPFFVVFWGEGFKGSLESFLKFSKFKLVKLAATCVICISTIAMLIPMKIFTLGNWITSLNFFVLILISGLFLITQKVLKLKSYLDKVAIGLASILVLATVPWPYGMGGQIANLFNFSNLLNHATPISYTASFEQLKTYVQKSKRYLSNESNLFEGPYDLGLDKAVMSTALPPPSSPKSEALAILNTLDLILVSKSWAYDSYSVGTQDLYKYFLHVQPFLDEKMKNGTWRCDKIEWYGEACVKL